ncbi:hypothetical protein [Paraburkholderia sp. BCC1876]|uniref:hypothetical protein n=1 Tax=Paraburkholderia sp. BCC1876 TaxID=2676303 RepID=UPI00159294DC|nr:hypothetical protein [Paraburkholderia sp. BCC1876]
MQVDMLEFFGMGSPRESAQALFLAGTLDRIIFKYNESPERLSQTGIRLSELIPSHGVIDFRTERLNHVFRASESRYGGAYINARLRPWVNSWAELMIYGGYHRVQINASSDRSKLISPDVLAGMFSLELPELASVVISAPGSWNHVDSNLARGIALLDSGSLVLPRDRLQFPSTLRDRFVNESDIVRTQDAGLESGSLGDSRENLPHYNAGLIIGTSSNRERDALDIFLTQENRVRAPAAIFIQKKRERPSVTGRLLDAAMERSGLMFASVIPSEGDYATDELLVKILASDYEDIAGLGDVVFRTHRNFLRGNGYGVSEFGGLRDREMQPLVRLRPALLKEILVDPRKHIDALIDGRFPPYDFAVYDMAAADSVAQRGITQLEELRQLEKNTGKRYVQLQVFAFTETVDDGQRRESVLRSSSDYVAKLSIDSLFDVSTTADRHFPSYERFGAGDESSKLDVIFTPLFLGEEATFSKGQIDTITVPKSGPSSSAKFAFTTPANLRDFRVRIVISHRTAVLQTLIFALEPLAGDQEVGIPYRLVVESELAEEFSYARPEQMKFDLSLILNDNLRGKPGVISIQNTEAVFFEPTGWEEFVSNVQDTLATLTAQKETPADLFDEEFVSTLRTLAWHGRTALKNFRFQAPQLNVSAAKNIQVVEAVTGAFLPIEFFYDGDAPNMDAPLCENSKAALLGGGCHEYCGKLGTEEVLCPLSFWGLSKRIERRSSIAQQRNIAVTVPADVEVAPRTLTAALVGASSKVRQTDLDGLKATMLASLKSVFNANKWIDWRSSLTEYQPDLLVLLPHSDVHPIHPEPSLEIGADYLAYAQMSEKYVASTTEARPIVLLLGCETAVPRSKQFMNFATDFWRYGASTVVATLSGVLGRHVSRFAGELTTEIAATAGRAGTTDFGTVLLLLKRRMLAEGNPLALTLICYGDTSWRIENGH